VYEILVRGIPLILYSLCSASSGSENFAAVTALSLCQSFGKGNFK
jgi:hypothetical protein